MRKHAIFAGVLEICAVLAGRVEAAAAASNDAISVSSPGSGSQATPPLQPIDADLSADLTESAKSAHPGGPPPPFVLDLAPPASSADPGGFTVLSGIGIGGRDGSLALPLFGAAVFGAGLLLRRKRG